MKIIPNHLIKNNIELCKFLNQNKNLFISLVYDKGIFKPITANNSKECVELFQNEKFSLYDGAVIISCEDDNGDFFGLWCTINLKDCGKEFEWVIIHNNAIYIQY